METTIRAAAAARSRDSLFLFDFFVCCPHAVVGEQAGLGVAVHTRPRKAEELGECLKKWAGARVSSDRIDLRSLGSRAARGGIDRGIVDFRRKLNILVRNCDRISLRLKS